MICMWKPTWACILPHVSPNINWKLNNNVWCYYNVIGNIIEGYFQGGFNNSCWIYLFDENVIEGWSKNMLIEEAMCGIPCPENIKINPNL